MAFVPGYRYDLFVSYAHVDDVPAAGEVHGWVTHLEQEIRRQLGSLAGRKDAFEIFIDRRHLHGGHSISSDIEAVVRSSAVFLLVMSPGYVGSKAGCLRELEIFTAAFSDRLLGRVLLVERRPVDKAEMPGSIAALDLKKIRFWDRDADDRVVIVGDPKPVDRFWSLASDVAERVFDFWKKLKDAPGAATAAPAPTNEPVLFLAEATEDMDEARDEVRRYVEQCGFRVLPDRTYPASGEAYRAEAQKDMGFAALYAQLLGPHRSKPRPDVPRGYQWLQLECADNAKLSVLHWRSPDVALDAIADSDHLALHKRPTVVVDTLESFKRELVRRLGEKKIALDRPAAQTPSTQAQVVITADPQELDLAYRLQDALPDELEKIVPPYAGSPEDIRAILENSVENCDVVVLVYGADPGWLFKQYQQIRKLTALRRKPLKMLAIYDGPPTEKPPVPVKGGNIQLVTARETLDPGPLRDLVRRHLQ